MFKAKNSKFDLLVKLLLLTGYIVLSFIIGIKTFYFVNVWDNLHSNLFSALHWIYAALFLLSFFKFSKNWIDIAITTLGVPLLIFQGTNCVQELVFRDSIIGLWGSITIFIISIIIFLTSLTNIHSLRGMYVFIHMSVLLTIGLLFFVLTGHEFFL